MNHIPRSVDEMMDKLDGTEDLTREERAFLVGYIVGQQEFTQYCAETMGALSYIEAGNDEGDEEKVVRQ